MVAGAFFVFQLFEITLVFVRLGHVAVVLNIRKHFVNQKTRIAGGWHEIVLGETTASRNYSLAVDLHVHDAG